MKQQSLRHEMYSFICQVGLKQPSRHTHRVEEKTNNTVTSDEDAFKQRDIYKL